MTRGNNPFNRCDRCRMHRSLCVCALMPALVTRTRVVLILHCFEDRKTTNTGRLAASCLVNSQVVLRGEARVPAPEPVVPASSSAVLFPSNDAISLDELVASAGAGVPLTLVVPDGSWRQASRVRHRMPSLQGIPCVRLPPGPPSNYQLRHSGHADRISTLEAIARALGHLEGAAVQRALERPFRAMVERTLWARGMLAASRVHDGVPEEAFIAARGGRG